MLDIFRQLFDLIAPPHQSIVVLRKENDATFLRFLAPQKIARTIALANYTNPKVRAAITANKFHNYDKAAKLLASLLNHWLATLPEKPTILIPIPLARGREKERGYNQVKRVLENLPNKNFKIQSLLKRQKETSPQTSLVREERLKNMIDAFMLDTLPSDLSGFRLIIVDDVTTTGATLHSALLTLKPKVAPECEIVCVALAH